MTVKIKTQTAILAATVMLVVIITVWTVINMRATDLSIANQSLDKPEAQAHIRQTDAAKPYPKLIQSLDIFGKETTAAQQTKTAVKKTRLQLKLLGVLDSPDNTQGSVVIVADNAGKEAAFQIGDTLPGGASLEAVYPDHVVLKYRGQLERLELKQQTVKLGNPPPP